MCGRYSRTRHKQDISEYFYVEDFEVDPEPRWNICPMQPAGVLVAREGRRRYRNMQWGFKPEWSKSTLINARADHLPTSRFFSPFLRAGQRCLFVADGYYEFVERDGLSLPFYTTLRDGSPMAFAGVWSTQSAHVPAPGKRKAPERKGRKPAKKEGGQLSFDFGMPPSTDGPVPVGAGASGDGTGLETTVSAPAMDDPMVEAVRAEGEVPPESSAAGTVDVAFIITTAPNDLMLQVGHDRMPVILDPGHFSRWLDPGTPEEELVTLFKSLDPALMQAWFVEPLVNKVAEDSPRCTQRIGSILTT